MKRQSGFTLIELVMVIVILGVLAAVAIPKFVDLKGNAQSAALSGVAGALSSASTLNYAARSASTSTPLAGNAVANCTDAKSSLQGGLPSGYEITSAAINPGVSEACTLKGPVSGASATFTAIGIL